MGYLEIVAAGIIWATTGPLLRALLQAGLTSWDVVLARSLFSLIFLGLWMAVGPRLPMRPRLSNTRFTSEDVPVFLALGLLAVVISQTTYFYALSHTSVAVAVTLNYTAPFWVMLLSYLLDKTPMTRAKSLALGTAVLGVALCSGAVSTGGLGQNMKTMGILAGLASGLSYGSQTLVYKRVGHKYGPIPLNFWTGVFGAAGLALLLTAFTGRAPEVFAKMVTATPRTWGLMALTGFGPGTIAFILFADGINKVDATKGSIAAMSEPVAACLLGYFLLGETLSFLQIAGVFLVLGSIWMISVPEKRSSQDRASRKRCS